MSLGERERKLEFEARGVSWERAKENSVLPLSMTPRALR